MPRRGTNIYMRKDGRWEGRYVKGSRNGKTQYGYVYGKTRGEVECLLDSQLQGISSNTKKNNISFSAVSSEWLFMLEPQLKESSMAKYKNILNTYLLPQYGEIEVQSIRRNDFLAFSRFLLVSGGAKSFILVSGLARFVL